MSEQLNAAMRELRRGVEVVQNEPMDAARRARIAERVSELTRDLDRQDQRRRRFAGLLSAAALVSGIVLYASVGDAPPVTPTESVVVSVTRGQLGLRDGNTFARLGAGEVELPHDGVVVAERETGWLRLSSRAVLELPPASEVALHVRPGAAHGRQERVKLVKGGVRLDVPKLGEHDGLAVETPHALVEVRGTRFSVQLVERPAMPSVTEVQVSEGRVWIHTGGGVQEIAAHQSWRSTPEQAPALPAAATLPVLEAPPAPVAATVTDVEKAPRSKPPLARGSSPLPTAATVASELAEQNRLLEAAGLAKENGMPGLALERLERLLESHPDAELAHNARVERFRLLAQMGRRAAARDAARDYLERHPEGFAQKEALLLLERATEAPR